MARNQEKAQTMLARWLRFREGEYKNTPQKRPYLAEQCDDLHAAEKWRGQIIREIGAKVTEIQNASLGEHRIRDLNDEINKLFREKYHWQRRIVQLGGIDYNKREYRNKDFAGMTLTTDKQGYMYFGAAKDLPGVKELLTVKMEHDKLRKQGKLYVSKDRVTGKPQRTRKEYYQMINGCNYYGFMDDDDGVLIKYEKIKEMKARNAKIQAYNNKHQNNKNQNINVSLCKDNENNANNNENNNNKRMRRTRITSMRVPSQKEIDAIILEKRKEMLLKKYEMDTPESQQLATQLKMNEKIKQTRIEMKKQMNNNNNNNNNKIDSNQDDNNNDDNNNGNNNNSIENEDIDIDMTKK